METSFAGLIEEIVKECRVREIEVSQDFVAFIVALVSMSLTDQPRDCIGVDLEDESKILDVVIEKLRNKSGTSLATLKIQFYFAKHYRDRDSVIRKYRSRLTNKITPLITEICEETKINNAREIEVLYQKMLVVSILITGMGNPKIPAVLREAAIALQSVLQPSELPRYVTLSRREKEEQLMELVFIVSGIRLFNRDCQRGGEGIDDLPTILQAGMIRTRSSIIRLLESLMEKVYKFTAVAEYGIQQQCFGSGFEYRTEAKNLSWVIEMLVAARQLEIYVRKLLVDLEVCENEISCLISRLQCRLNQLHQTVKYRTAVPTTQVYPQFIEIAQIWIKLQDEVIVLSYINDMITNLQNLFPRIKSSHERILKRMLHNVDVLTDAERLEQTMGKLIIECGECPLAYPSGDLNFDKVNLQFLGFCPWSFAIGKGALIPGNPNIGLAEWRGTCFAFSSVEAARQFGESPDRYIYDVFEVIKKHQEYIHLFQLYKEIYIMKEKFSSECCLPLKVLHDREVQTETHVLPVLINKEYSHSLWEHRQQALRWARVCQCLTRSTQTYKSHYKRGIVIQTLETRDKEIQTRKDAGTNTTRLKKSIFGLRNENDDVELIECSLNDQRC